MKQAGPSISRQLDDKWEEHTNLRNSLSDKEFDESELTSTKSEPKDDKKGEAKVTQKLINENFVEIPNLSDVEHTRVVKWMSQNLENDYSIKKMDKGYHIDVHKLSKNEFDELIGYLQSQYYL